MDTSRYSSCYDLVLHLPSSVISSLLHCSQILITNQRAGWCAPGDKSKTLRTIVRGAFAPSQRMKHTKVEARNSPALRKEAAVPLPPPPPPPPLPDFRAGRAVAETSVTNREIARFWRQKRMDEEDHLLAAIKAAARVRARKLSEDGYKRFVESLEDVNDDAKENNAAVSNDMQNHAEEEKEVHIGIKDWWTKSKYAYLNQPALESVDQPRRTSSYTPNCFSYKPVPLYPTSLGVF